MARFTPIAAALSLVLASCAVGRTEDFEELDPEVELDTGTEDTDLDTGDLGDEVVYWSLDGVLMVVDGEVRVEGSALELGFWSTGGQVLECDMEIPVQHIEPSAPPQDVPLVSWWHVTLDLGDSACDDAWDHYASMFLGLGQLDTRLLPAMEANDLTVDTLYSLYVQEDPEAIVAPVYLFGVAGTSENFGGADPAVEYAPLPDGAYALQGLHLLPYTTPPEE